MTELIYDLGAHNGDDTAFYLGQGYRVLAVEPHPLLAENLRQRFAQEIRAGRLTVLQAAIADADQKKMTFYISRADWKSSLIKEISAREAEITGTVELITRTPGSLFAEFGLPYYCKMDIEGYDARVIAGMARDPSRPPYLSCEVCCHEIGEIQADEQLLYCTLDGLVSAGYSAFKLVDQDHFAVLAGNNHYGVLHRLPARVLEKIRRIFRPFLARAPRQTTSFFAEQLPGKWEDQAATKKYLSYHFRDYFRHTRNKRQIFWVDIHAKYSR